MPGSFVCIVTSDTPDSLPLEHDGAAQRRQLPRTLRLLKFGTLADLAGSGISGRRRACVKLQERTETERLGGAGVQACY